MLRAFSDWQYRSITTRRTIAATALFVAFVLTVAAAELMFGVLSSGPQPVPDLMPGYAPSDLYPLFERYSAEERTHFVWMRFTLDLVWPILYAGALCAWMSAALGRTVAASSALRLANLLPALAALLDALENMALSVVILRAPLRTPGVDLAASLFTLCKWSAVVVSVLALLWGLGRMARGRTV